MLVFDAKHIETLDFHGTGNVDNELLEVGLILQAIKLLATCQRGSIVNALMV